MADNSWAVELAEFYQDIFVNRPVDAGLQDAYESLKVIQQIYRISNYDF